MREKVELSRFMTNCIKSNPKILLLYKKMLEEASVSVRRLDVHDIEE